MGWILGAITAVLALGYVAYKYPDLFEKMVAGGAAWVDKVISKLKD